MSYSPDDYNAENRTATALERIADAIDRFVDRASAPTHIYLPWVVNGQPECSMPWCKEPPESHPRPPK